LDSLVAVLSSVPIEEKDWWTCTTDTSNSATTSFSGDEDDNNNTHTNNNDSPCSKDISIDSTNSAESSSSSSVQFHNRGYEVWEQCRAVWIGERNIETCTEKKANTPPSSPNNRRNRLPLTNYQRRQVMANLARQREYTLPKKLRLDHVIGVYQDIWNQESSD
jgi:hypothetical protein